MQRHLQSFLDYLRLNRNVSRHTARAYEGDLAQFLAFADGRLGRAVRPDDLDHRLVRAFLGELYARGRARASSARKLAAIRSFCRYLRREGDLDHDPGALVSTPKLDRKMPAHLDLDEIGVLLAAPDAGSPLGRRDRAILELFYASGLRLSELVGLDVEDVNLSGRLVRVLGKGGKERIVPFNRSTAGAIRGYLPDRRMLMARAPASGLPTVGARTPASPSARARRRQGCPPSARARRRQGCPPSARARRRQGCPPSARARRRQGCLPPRDRARDGTIRSLSTTAAAGSPGVASIESSAATWRSRAPGWASALTPCATRLRRTCWNVARICDQSRSCWGTLASPRRSATRM